VSPRLLQEALAREGEAYRRLLDGDAGAAGALREVSELYLRSWEEEAGPRSYGRLIGMVKAAVLAGDGAEEAAYARRALGDAAETPTGWYALALAASVEGDDALARSAAAGMREGGDAFERTADAIDALAGHDGERYRDALGAIVADFEAREEHVTGVAIADTALVLERLAARREMAAGVDSPLLPAD
jgi:hypothetical protein